MLRSAKRDCDASKKESFVIAAHQFLGRAKPSPLRLGAPSKSRFVTPLFSWSYELLFPQLFYFDNHLRCPPGVGPLAAPNAALLPLRYHLPVLCHSHVFNHLQISPSTRSICRPLIFKRLQIPFSSTRLFSHLYKNPGWRGASIQFACSARLM